ncbi:hypothetical protein [Rhizobium sp. SGZ-381]|uniref:hypothetical protein n=1 Tax=Rhizobium sp. SGZ-381 TaxID=3342800 RepID=UPI00366D4195
MRKSQQRTSRQKAMMLNKRAHRSARMKARWESEIARPLKRQRRWNRQERSRRMVRLCWMEPVTPALMAMMNDMDYWMRTLVNMTGIPTHLLGKLGR